MKTREFHGWMWSDALALIERAERMQRHFFLTVGSPRGQTWEPPVDVIEDAAQIRVLVALPGVKAGAVSIGLEPGRVVVTALRSFPERLPDSRIHRLEIPYGRFERRIPLPAHAELVGRSLDHGVLTLTFRKLSQNKEVA